MPHGKRIAELLIDIGAVKLSLDPPFTWTSGIKSPIYCDNRMVFSHPDARNFVVDALVQRVRALHIEPDVIAGTATAAIGWAALVADRMDLPFVYVKHKSKDYGTSKLIEGDLCPEKHVVVVEDLISTGGSSVRTVGILRDDGQAVVTDIVAIFTYELLKSFEAAQEAGVSLHALSDFTQFLQVAEEQGRLAKGEREMIARFAQDPEGWGASVGTGAMAAV